MTAPEPDFRLLFESAPGLYLVLTPDLQITAVSDAYLRATMTERDAILGRGLFEVFPDNPADPNATGTRNLRASLDRVLQSGKPDAMTIQKYDIRRPESEGGSFEERYWSPVNSPVFGPDGALVNIIHRVEDVTDFVRLKQEGRQHEQVTEALRIRSEQMDAEIYHRAQEVAEANRQLKVANDALARLYGQIGRLMLPAREDWHPHSALPEPSIGPEEMLSRVSDLISAYQSLQQELHQAQKMEAIGQLAGGVAHDFNNLLTVILGQCKLLLACCGEDETLRRRLSGIREAGERGAALTQQLLAFGRKQVLRPVVLDLAEILKETNRMLLRVIGENIDVSTVIEPDLWPVEIDPTQMQQVIMNLAVNARDAMPDGGSLTLELRNAEMDELHAKSHNMPAGKYVMLMVSDSGSGMDPEIRNRVFEPFFTTKKSAGTGLGLSTVYGIVKQSLGHIWLYSEVGKGTMFKIFLPKASGSPASIALSTTAEIQRGHETILLVEDDSRVRTLFDEILTSAGYRVIAAGSGEEAFQRSSDFPGEIHLLVTDVILPNMGGRQIADRFAAGRPGTRVLYMSGYSGEAITHQGVLDEHIAFIQKPFGPSALCSKIRAVLDAPR